MSMFRLGWSTLSLQLREPLMLEAFASIADCLTACLAGLRVQVRRSWMHHLQVAGVSRVSQNTSDNCLARFSVYYNETRSRRPRIAFVA